MRLMPCRAAHPRLRAIVAHEPGTVVAARSQIQPIVDLAIDTCRMCENARRAGNEARPTLAEVHAPHRRSTGLSHELCVLCPSTPAILDTCRKRNRRGASGCSEPVQAAGASERHSLPSPVMSSLASHEGAPKKVEGLPELWLQTPQRAVCPPAGVRERPIAIATDRTESCLRMLRRASERVPSRG